MNCDLLRWAASQKLKHAEFSVLVILAAHTDESGQVNIAKAEIADQIELTDRQVHTILGRLAGRGLLTKSTGKREGRGRPSNVYALNYGSLVPEADFTKSTSRSPIPEETFQNSELMKPTSGSQLQEPTSKNHGPVDNPVAHIEHGPARGTSNLNTTCISELNPETEEPSGEGDRAFALTTPPKSVSEKSKRGSRLGSKWRPGAEGERYAALAGITGEWLEALIENFVGYWSNIPGHKGLKLDWGQAWEGEVRKEKDAQRHKPSVTGGPPQRFSQSRSPYGATGITRMAYTG